MRTLILMRGSPGCGKTTWINEHGLQKYALSADAIREMFASPELAPDGSIHISQRNDKIVWETLFSMLERRMQRGDFTIIDACNSKSSEMKRYKDLADQYRYRMYCIDLTGIPMEEAIRRNNLRPANKIVPGEYIRRVYSRFETQQIPSGIKRVLPDDFDSILSQPFDLSEYTKVVHVGDIHGCYDALQKCFGQDPASAIDPNTAYIFLGDYCDRGDDSPLVLKFLMEISSMPNVCLLEGNHEAHLWAWANDRKSRSCEFETRTKFQLEAAGINKTDVRRFYRRLRQCSDYLWNGTRVICTHGGLSCFNTLPHIDFVPTIQMIKGVGWYEDAEVCCESFERNNPDGIYQVFGHRNVTIAPTQIKDHSFVLEGHVENGGALRVVTLNKDGWKCEEFVSDKASVRVAADATTKIEDVDVEDAELIRRMVEQMRSSPLIVERQFGHISSFNFTRSAFEDKKWNDLTLKARGLYIDTQNMKIVARGYEKFFNVGERDDTRLGELGHRLKFPVEVYQKENGFLGLMSYDKSTDNLFTTTKSSLDGKMARLFGSMLDDNLKTKALGYLKDHDVTLLFEVIHPEADPHIIKYEKPELFLLDSVDNSLDFRIKSYDELVEIGNLLGVKTKKRVAILANMEDFAKMYNLTQTALDAGIEPFEGYVTRDADGFMLKMKTDYYTTWKILRSVADKVFKQGYIRNTSMLRTPLMNYFYAFVKQYYAEHKEHKDIISLRNKFLDSQNIHL